MTKHSKAKMPWLRARLTALDETPSNLARYLNIAEPRVHEIIGGRRAVQPDEVVPLAKFLRWPLFDVVDRLPPGARYLPAEMCLRPKDAETHLASLRSLLGVWP